MDLREETDSKKSNSYSMWLERAAGIGRCSRSFCAFLLRWIQIEVTAILNVHDGLLMFGRGSGSVSGYRRS